MLQQSTNPPQFSSAGQLSAKKPLVSPFDIINADIMPIEVDGGNELLDTLCYMKDEADVLGMVELFEAYATSAEQLMVAADRADGRAGQLLHADGCQAWAKAYLVADFLKDMRPNKWIVGRYASVLHKAAHQMGATFGEAAAVIAEVASWELEQA